VIAAVLAGAAGALAAVGTVLAMPRPGELPIPLRGLATRLSVEARRTLDMLHDLGSVGAPLEGSYIRRLRLTAGLAGAASGATFLGMPGAVVCGVAGTWLVPRIAAARRRRYGHRLDEGAASAARAIADATSAGASVRTAIAVAAHRLSGPIATELRRTAWELEIGAGTEAALERLRSRSASRAVALIVAAMQVQRRSGGDLGRVLRDVATALEQDGQVIEEANAATAQARFTAMVVVALPVCGIALGALASPDLPGRMTGSPLGMGLLTASLALQISGALVIRRLARSWR
jgi:tight adherence protein B